MADDEAFIRRVIDQHPAIAALRAMQAFNLSGSGSPVGKLQAPVGADYAQIDGAAGSSKWVKTGPANTNWTAVA